jgi:multiple sugar transport system permease protein
VRVGSSTPSRLAQFIGQEGSQWNLMMAASIMAMVPSVILVILLQKNLVRGLLTTGFGGR